MKRLKPRASGALAVALATSLTLAGCGGATPGGAGSSQAGGNAGNSSASGANAWVLTGGGWPVIEQSFKTWSDAHPDQKIAVETFANDAFKEKIRTAVGSGEAPTLILNWTGGTLNDYVKNKQVVDITADTKALVSRVMPSVAQNGVVDGATYAVPMNDVQPVVMYYNKSLFDQVGAAVPTTYQELLDAVTKFRAAGIAPISIAGQSVWPELMWIQYLTDRIGGPDVFQAILDGKPNAWSDPAVTEALSKIQELVKAGAFVDGFASVTADQGADFALVHTGRAAMILQGSWGYATFKNDAPEFFASSLGFAKFPAVEGGKGDPANIVGNPANFWSVSANATDAAKKAAINYLNESVYSEDVVKAMLDAGSVPPITGLDDQIAASSDAEYLSFAYKLVGRRPALPAVLGPGAAAEAGHRTADEPEPDLPGPDHARAVRRGDERDAVMAVSDHRRHPSRRGGPTAAPGGAGRQIKKGAPFLMVLPALIFFGAFALLPLARGRCACPSWIGMGWARRPGPVWPSGRIALTNPVTLHRDAADADLRRGFVPVPGADRRCCSACSWPVASATGLVLVGALVPAAAVLLRRGRHHLQGAARSELRPEQRAARRPARRQLAGRSRIERSTWSSSSSAGASSRSTRCSTRRAFGRFPPRCTRRPAWTEPARCSCSASSPLPQLRYTIITSSTLMIVGSLTYFDLIFVLTGGGPGNATRILPLDMYLTGFRSYDMGAASAIGVILVAVGLTLVAAAQPALRGRQDGKSAGGPVMRTDVNGSMFRAASVPGCGWSSPSCRSTTSC